MEGTVIASEAAFHGLWHLVFVHEQQFKDIIESRMAALIRVDTLQLRLSIVPSKSPHGAEPTYKSD